jgi:outer membrane protein assembly factor BamE (lipoprotein component of BamABCDE complex)
VRIGMTAEEARKKLGSPTDKADTQDFYVVSEKESVQVMYDGEKKVSAIALIYMNAGDKAPAAKAVIGDDDRGARRRLALQAGALPEGRLLALLQPHRGHLARRLRTNGRR